MSSFVRPDPPAFPIVVSGPSGVGKTVLCAALCEALPGLVRSISATTRAQREGERDGDSYFFYPRERFLSVRDDGGMAEWAEVHGRLYGTPRAFLDAELAAARSPVLNIDVQGGLQIRERYRDAVLVFVLPPSLAVLEARLRGRKSDSIEEIQRRLRRAEEELAFVGRYDYAIVNGELPPAVEELRAVVLAERLRVTRRAASGGERS